MKKQIFSILLLWSCALFTVPAFSSASSAFQDGIDKGNGIAGIIHGNVFDGIDRGNGIDGVDKGNGIA